MLASQQKDILKDYKLPHYFAAAAALQEQQQDYTSPNPDQNLHHRAIHEFLSFLSKWFISPNNCADRPV